MQRIFYSIILFILTATVVRASAAPAQLEYLSGPFVHACWSDTETCSTFFYALHGTANIRIYGRMHDFIWAEGNNFTWRTSADYVELIPKTTATYHGFNLVWRHAQPSNALMMYELMTSDTNVRAKIIGVSPWTYVYLPMLTR